MDNFHNWKIDDTLFYPLGLFSNASKSKVVFVAWGFNSIITCIFKKTGNASSLVDIYKMSFSEIMHDIITTEKNTICLTKEGNIFYFASCKSLKKLNNLHGIRCFCSRTEGFAIIRVDTDSKQIYLETYPDFSDVSELHDRCNVFNLTFDEKNIFNSSYSEQTFHVICIVVNATNKQFLSKIVKKTVDNIKEIFFFTMSNSLFCVYSNSTDDPSDYEIILLHTVSGNIDCIRYLEEMETILLFMSSGAIEILYLSKLSETIERNLEILCSNIVSITFDETCFYYSDGYKVVKVYLLYDDENHILGIIKNEKPVRGIAALTYSKSLKKLICLSENNIFYRIKFGSSKSEKKSQELYELTPEKIKIFQRDMIDLLYLSEEPKNINEKIEKELLKQEVLSIAQNKYLYKDLLTAQITYCAQMPITDTNTDRLTTFFPEDSMNISKDSYFIKVLVQITPSKIFKSGMWNLLINLDGETQQVRCIRIIPDYINEPFNIILHVKELKYFILPRITVDIISLVHDVNDSLCIHIPSSLIQVHLKEIISSKSKMLFQDSKTNTINNFIIKLTQQNHLLDSNAFSTRHCITKIPTPMVFSREDLSEIFQFNKFSNHDNNLTLFVLNKNVHVEHKELDNCIIIKSTDAGASFVIKTHLIEKINKDIYAHDNIILDEFAQIFAREQLEAMKKFDYDSLNSIGSYWTYLQKMYQRLRVEINKPF